MNEFGGTLYRRMPTIPNWGTIAMSCDEKARPAKIYETATGKFPKAVTDLRHKIGVSTKEEYECLERAANEARLKSEQARLALEQHTSAHNY
jgi:hypothetical protein